MKKLMKAIAFATVMCMLLSTAAFAAVTPGTVNYETLSFDVTIDGVGAEEQVSLLIVKDGTITPDSTNILYVDQAASDASGSVKFPVVLNTNETTVEIWSGNATYAANNTTAPVQIAELSLEEPITDVIIKVNEIGSVTSEKSEANDYTGTGLYAELSFEKVPTGYTVQKMIWAIETNDGFRYTKSLDLAELGYTVFDGAVKYAAALNNGSENQGIATETVKSVEAIFLFTNSADEELDAFTNPDNAESHTEKKVTNK